jgi:hypothetical protein
MLLPQTEGELLVHGHAGGEMLWRIFQGSIVAAVIATNKVFDITPSGYVAALYGVGAALVATIALTALFDLGAKFRYFREVLIISIAAVAIGAVMLLEKQGAQTAYVSASGPQSMQVKPQNPPVTVDLQPKTYAPGTVLPLDSPFAGWRVMEQ